MFNNILVAYDGSSSSRAATQQVLELARANNAEVTVLSVAPSVAPLASLGGVSIDKLGAELKQWAARTVREGASLAPSELNVHTVTRSGTSARKSSPRSKPEATTSSCSAHAAAAG